MSESAQKRGKKLLERFQEEKNSARRASAANSPADALSPHKDPYFDAIANGSLLGICYSESKKKERNTTPLINKTLTIAREVEADDLSAESPLEMLRFALLQLNNLEESLGNQADGSFANITSLLQGVEEYLERSNNTRMLSTSTVTPRRQGKVNTKLGFSAERPSRKAIEDDEILNQSTYTPVKGDQSSLGGYRTQRSIFMENQLDLNESEMEYYEEVVNDLAEKLERMQEEKDDLQSISNALGDRLQRLSQQKEEALRIASAEFDGKRLELENRIQELQLKLADSTRDFQRQTEKISDLESNLSLLRAKIKDDDQKLHLTSEQNASLAEKVASLSEELRMLSSFQTEESKLTQKQLKQQESNVDTLQATINSLTKSRAELVERIAELEKTSTEAATLRRQVDELRHTEQTLTNELTSLRTHQAHLEATHQREVSLLQEKMQHQQQEAQRHQSQLQNRLNAAETAAQRSALLTSPARISLAHKEPVDKDEAQRHAEEVAELKERIEDLEVELADSQGEVDSLSSTIEDLRMRIDAAETPAEAPTRRMLNQSHLSPQRSFDASSFRYENDHDISVVRIAPSPFGKTVDRINTSMEAHAGQRSVLKVYMDNQLDLNSEELEYYEKVVNSLASEVEQLRQDKDQLTAERETHISSLEVMRETVQLLQADLKAKEEDFLRLQEAQHHQHTPSAPRSGSSVSSGGKSGKPPLTPQQLLTNEFLGLDGSNESDEEPSPNTQQQGRLATHSFDSFHSTGEHVYSRSNKEDLRAIIEQREQQVKVHISQLQAQQESIQELKNAVEVLREQKQSLKKSLADATARVEELQNSELTMLNRVAEFEERLQEALERAEEFQGLYAQAEARYDEAKYKVNDLLHVTAQYRLEVEQLQEQQKHMQLTHHDNVPASGKKVISTPSPPSSGLRGVTDSGGSRHESSVQQRLKRAEAQVDQLALQVRVYEKTNEEVQMEYDKLQVRFQTKLRLAEAQNQDIMDLRLEIDKLLEENDRIKLHEMQTEANLSLKEIDNQSEIELLQHRVRELEEENRQLIELLRTRQMELQNEVASNRSLKEILERYGERDSTTEELLNELRTDRDTARKQLKEVSEKLHVQARTVTEYHEQYEILQRQLQHREQESVSMQKRIELLQGETQGETRNLYLRLEDLSNENQSVEDALREQKQKTSAAERELKARASELESARRAQRNLVDIVRSHYSKVLNAQDLLAQQVQAKLSRVDARVDSATWNVHTTISEVTAIMNGTENDRRIVEKALRDTQALLQSALDRHDLDAAEKDEAWAKYDDSQHQVRELQRTLDQVNAQLVERIDLGQTLDAQAHEVEEEFVILEQRLKESEERAEQMASDNARAFAKAARTEAYLEGECTRLKGLLEHLRTVNEKMTEDLKIANQEASQVKSFEHRMKLSEQDQAALQKRIDSLEAALQQKEQELLEAMDLAREQEEERAERFEQDYNAVTAQHRALQERYTFLTQEHSTMRQHVDQLVSTHSTELDATNQKLLSTEKELSRQLKKKEEVEFELRSVRNTLQEQEHLHAQCATKITLLIEEARVSKETHASTVRELSNEAHDRTEALRQKDIQLAQLKLQVNRLESDFIQRDEEIAGKLLRRVTADDENRQLRVQLDAQSSDILLMRSRIEDLQIKVTNLTQQSETLREQDEQSRSDLETTTRKLQEARDTTRRLSDELEKAQSENTHVRNQLTTAQNSLSTTEHKLQSLQTDFFSVQANEQALQAHNEGLTQDNSYLRKQVDELVPKLSASSRECVSLRNQLSEQTELVMDLRREAEDHETRMLRIRDDFGAFEIAEADIVTEMREISEMLASSVGVDPMTNANAVQHAAQRQSGKAGDHFHIGMDLFASPPLAVMRSPLNLYSATEGTDLTADIASSQSDVLSGIKYNISTLKSRSSNLLVAYHKTFESLEKVIKEKEDLRKDFERAKEKIQLAAYDKEALQAKLHRADEEQDALRAQVEALEQRTSAWVSSSVNHSQRMSAVLREMDSGLLESLAKANDAVAGVVPISTDALPNLRISEAIIQFDEARGHSNFHQVTSPGLSVEPDHHSSSAVLTVSVNEVARASEYLLGVIRNLVREYRKQSDLLTKSETSTEQKEASWDKERKQLFTQQAELESELSEVQGRCLQVTADLEAHRSELERTRQRVDELHDNNAALEIKVKNVLDERHDMKQELHRSEAANLDLRSKLRNIQLEMEKRNDEISQANEQLEDAHRRITEGELNHERTSSQLGRTKAEKDALDNVRRSLESELERSRAEVIALRECTKALDDDHRSSFEVEKVLAALTTTMDQMVASSGMKNGLLLNTSTEQSLDALVAATGGSAASSFLTTDSHRGTMVVPSHLGQDVPLSVRVDTAVKRLSSLRHWSREEARAKRIMEGQLEALSVDAASAHASAEDAQRQVKQLLQSSAQREKELKEKTGELLEKELEVRRLEEELSKLRFDGSSVAGRLEDEKKHGLTLAEQISFKDQEVARLRTELDNKASAVSRLQEQLQMANDQLSVALEESSQRAEQLRVAKNNSERIMTTMEQIERGAAADKQERESAERRCAEAEEQVASLTRHRARATELEQKLALIKEESKIASRAKVVAEEHSASMLQELAASQKKVQSLEHRIETIMLEKNSFVDEVAETRRKIALAKQYADQERSQRMKADAAMALLKRSGEESRVDLVEYATMAEEADSLQTRAEEEKRSLRQKINELKHTCDEKESLRQNDINDRKKLESDIKQLKSALAKRSADLASSSNYSAQLRTEGRHARQLVMHAVKHIREILTIVRKDAKSAGVDIKSPDFSRSSKPKTAASAAGDASTAEKDPLEVTYDEALPLGLGEALGINDLTEALEALREGIVYISAAPVNRQTMQSRVAQLETENAHIQKELQSSETKRTELVSRYKEEIQTMHLHITELRRTDSKNPHLMHQISELEAAVKMERERREKAVSEVTLLKSRLEQMGREAMQHQPHRNFEHSHMELDSLRSELDKYRTENTELVQELSAVNHHRTVLRDTLDQLDREVRERVDLLSDLQASSRHHTSPHGKGRQGLDETALGVMGDVEEGLHRQVLRYKARAKAFEELSTIYRTSVLALYADGASYGAAQFGWQPHSGAGASGEFSTKPHHIQLIGVGWIEREMNAVKHSYEDEVRLLDAEAAELRAKLRQSNSYIMELRKSFEENMRSIYRTANSTSTPGEGMAHLFEQTQQELEAMHSEMTSLQQDLVSERAQGRTRHSHLVETLTAALQARDAALGALKRLESFCHERHLDINGLAVYESLKADMSTLNAATSAYDYHRQHQQEEQQQVVETMMRGLVEVDHELAESERRYRALRSSIARGASTTDLHHHHSSASSGNVSVNQSRSTSRNSRYSSAATTHAATPTAAAAAAANAFVAAHPQSHVVEASYISQQTASMLHHNNQSTHSAMQSLRHVSPSAVRQQHPSTPAGHRSTAAHTSSVNTPSAGTSFAATTPAASQSRLAQSPSLYQQQHTQNTQHEQRLTKDFLTKTSPTNSPSSLAHAHQHAQQAQHTAQVAPHVAPATSTHASVSAAQHILSTSTTSRMRTHVSSNTTTHRESSYQLPVSAQSSGSGTLRVNRSSTPLSSVTGPSTTATGAASQLPRRTHARNSTEH